MTPDDFSCGKNIDDELLPMVGLKELFAEEERSVLSDECIAELSAKTGASPERIREIEAKALPKFKARLASLTPEQKAQLIAEFLKGTGEDAKI